MADLGRLLIGLGCVLALVGAALVFGGRWGLGHLLGDFVWRRGNATFAFPLATGIVVSVLLTVILNLLLRRK